MKIILTHITPYTRLKADALILPLFKGEKEIGYAVPASVKKLVRAVIDSKEFQGSALETEIIYTGERAVTRICLLGLGEKKACTRDLLTRAAGTAVMRLKKARARSVVFAVREDAVHGASAAEVCGALALGGRIGNYHFRTYKTKKKQSAGIDRVLLMIAKKDHAAEAAIRRAEIIADGMDTARNLGNTPPNHATPHMLGETARALPQVAPGLTVTVLGKKEIEKEKMGGLLSVAQGSQHEPRFVVCEYKGALRPPPGRGRQAQAKPIVLIGKAVTFDTGGISLKPWQRMEEMKFDMCGGAAVLGIMTSIARLKLPVHVIGLVPAAENMPSHNAYKPGDVLTMSDGTTVEVLTTDAEGRLLIADAMVYARRYTPEIVIDVATLTGAIIAALGDYASGLFTDDAALAEQLERIGGETGDRTWHMPLVKEWGEGLKSPVADLRQVPSARIADATMAALFIQHFVPKKARWVHLDIAGNAWKTEGYPYAESGAMAAAVRLLVAWLEEEAKRAV